jgi:hypothetical protein
MPPDPDTPDARAHALKCVLALALLGGVLLSPRLWLSSRAYPLAPVGDLLPPLPTPWDLLGLLALLLLPATLLAPTRPRLALLVLVGVGTLLALQDQSRWQPWFYQYLLMLAALAFYPWGNPVAPPGSRQGPLNACRLVVAGLYFWSGLQKVNASFVTEVYPWLLEPSQHWLPGPVAELLGRAGWAVGLGEAGIGLGLLVPLLRPLAIALALLMHVFILAAIGPTGHHWNTVVWPWNVAMVLFVLLLFGRSRDVSLRAILWPGRCVPHWAALVLCGLLPALNFAERWDSYLSASLYSGTTLDGSLLLSERALRRLPDEVRRHATRGDDGRQRLDLWAWSFAELNVPPYPERRVYRRIAHSLVAPGDGPGDVVLVISERPSWRSTRRRETTYEASQR